MIVPVGVDVKPIREIDRELEVGADAGFLRDRVHAEATYYQKRADDDLFRIDVSDGLPGARLSDIPVGILNSGLELLATASLIQRPELD